MSKPKTSFLTILKHDERGNKSTTAFAVKNSKENITVITDKPLSNTFITTNIQNEQDYKENLDFLVSQYSAEHFESDAIFNKENLSYSYSDYIKPNVSSLLRGKSSSCFIFGSREANKTELLFDERIGYVPLAINDLFNFLSLSNDFKTYRIRFSLFMNLNDNIYDLLRSSSKPIEDNKFNNITVEDLFNNTNNNDNSNSNNNLNNVINDFKPYYQRALENRRRITSTLNNTTDLSDFVLSIQLYNQGDLYSKLDFVELVPCEYGLNMDLDSSQNNRFVYENINAIANNIYSSAVGSKATHNSTLTKILGNSINNNSEGIVFINLLLSNVYPSHNSVKSMKFSSWIRNQIIEVELKESSVNRGMIRNSNSNNSIITTINIIIFISI